MYNPAGLINQLMSIELAVGISEITKNEITIYGIQNGNDRKSPIYSASRHKNKRGSVVDNSTGFVITDILEWKNKEDFTLVYDNLNSIEDDCTTIENMMLYYYDLEGIDDIDFSENRQKIIFSDNMHIKNTLGFYSRFFNNRTKSLDYALSSVKFLTEYYELAEVIAKSLGDFNGAHLRLTDHISQRVDTTQEMFDAGIEKIDDGKPIVICTDDTSSSLLSSNKNNFIMLDEYVLSNFSKEFLQFKYRDEVSFGLLNNLIMHYSKKFVGTIGSTYTGFIQRGMNQDRDIEWNWFDYVSDPIYKYSGLGPYSWNGLNNIYTIDKQWHREWKESRLNI